MSVPVATANVICSILVVSKSPLFADPSRTTIINIIIKHKLEACESVSRHLLFSNRIFFFLPVATGGLFQCAFKKATTKVAPASQNPKERV